MHPVHAALRAAPLRHPPQRHPLRRPMCNVAQHGRRPGPPAHEPPVRINCRQRAPAIANRVRYGRPVRSRGRSSSRHEMAGDWLHRTETLALPSKSTRSVHAATIHPVRSRNHAAAALCRGTRAGHHPTKPVVHRASHSKWSTGRARRKQCCRAESGSVQGISRQAHATARERPAPRATAGGAHS